MTTLPKRGLPALIAGTALIGSLAFAGPALAAGQEGFEHGARPAVVGVVAAAPDTHGTFTVTATGWRHGSSNTTNATTYTVETTGTTTITKNGTPASISAIAAGDKVMVRGTVDGTTIRATSIRDGMMGVSDRKPDEHPTTLITGNGQPVIGGSVTAMSSTTLTVTTKSGIVYNVNAASAKVIRMGTTTTLSAIVPGDTVIVQGAVNGTSVTAASIVDQGTLMGAPDEEKSGKHRGFLSAIGGFFSHLFGFF